MRTVLFSVAMLAIAGDASASPLDSGSRTARELSRQTAPWMDMSTPSQGAVVLASSDANITPLTQSAVDKLGDGAGCTLTLPGTKRTFFVSVFPNAVISLDGKAVYLHEQEQKSPTKSLYSSDDGLRLSIDMGRNGSANVVITGKNIQKTFKSHAECGD